MTQKTELELLNEAVSSNDIHIVARLIKSYLTKRVGKEFFQFPGVEYYTVGGKTYTGVRFFYGKSASVRFNWIGKSIGQDTLDSVTVWKDKDDKFEIEFDHNVSLVKVLPFIVPILKNPHTTEFDFVPVDESVNVSIAEKKEEDISEMSMMNTKKASDLIKQHTFDGESLATHKSQIAERIRRKIGAKHIQILDHDSIRHEAEFVLKDEQPTVNEEVIQFRRSQADRVKSALKNIPGGVSHATVGNDHIVSYDKSAEIHVKNALSLFGLNPNNKVGDYSQKVRTSNYDAIASTTAAKEKAEQEKKNKEEREKTAKKAEAKKSEKNESEDLDEKITPKYLSKDGKSWGVEKGWWNRKDATDLANQHGANIEHGEKTATGNKYHVVKNVSEDLDESKKKIGEYSNGSNVTKVYKLTGEHNEGDPYVVHLHKNGKHYEPADYFTNDEEDAHGTAKHMVQEAEEKDQPSRRTGWRISMKKHQALADAHRVAGNTEEEKAELANVGFYAKKLRESEDQVELIEAVEVDSSSYQYSHQKRPSGRGTWMFSKSSSGIDFSKHKEGEHYITVNDSYGDAKKKAVSWAKEKGHNYLRLMESSLVEDADLEESTDAIVINESEELATDIRKYIAKMSIGDKIGYREVKLALSRQHFKLFQVIVETNPHVFDTSGKSPVFIGNPNKIDYARAIEAAGGAHVKVTRSTAHEQSLDKTPEEDLEDQATKISYKEKVSHLAGLVKLLKSGATNALFVAGEGGTGKTFTVEEELAKQGLKDGDGYFKNTGSTSTAALYETLYKYRKDIVLFDDCDAVFGDQDSRNILKSATDTKAKRKVAFNKKGSAYYDPAFQAEPDDDSQLPKYFDFEGKIIFISNLPMKKLDPDGALRTRGFFVELSPSNEEMLEFMGEILGKIQLNDGLSLTMAQRKEVLAFVREGGGERGSERISLRKLVRALNVRASFVDAPGDEWKTFVRNYS